MYVHVYVCLSTRVMDGWMDGRTDGGTDGSMSVCVYVSASMYVCM